jgi:rhodanese-related sulfurtransferase
MTPQEAKQRLDGDEGYVYLDVRTVAEFEAGHVPGALNIPVAQRNAATGEMKANTEFLSVVGASVAKDARVIVGCKSGGRSVRAVRLMLDSGYRNVFNLLGGFSGKRDESGEVIHPGWSTLDLPVEHTHGHAHSYQSLRNKTAP